MKTTEETYQRIADNELSYQRPGEFGCLLAGFCFFAFPTGVAISYLLDFRTTPRFGLVCAGLWLSLVGLIIFGFLQQGLRKTAFDTLAACVRNRFIEVSRDDDPVLGIGFWFRGRRHYELKVRGSGITGLEWSAGQNTWRYHQNTGKRRDFNDWHVILWFQESAVEVGDGRLFLPGLEGSPADAEQFGKLLAGFLADNGIEIRLPTDEIIGKTGIVVKREFLAYEIRVEEDVFRTTFADDELALGSKVTITGQRGTHIDIEPLT